MIEHGSRTLSKDKMVVDGLTDMLHNLERDYGKLLSKRNANLAKQLRSLDCFNVMLFGRTMAGKVRFARRLPEEMVGPLVKEHKEQHATFKSTNGTT